MDAAHLEWDYQRRNLLLSEFEIAGATGDSWNDRSFAEAISDISDNDLLEMHHIVTGVRPADVAEAIEAAEPGRWKTGYVRLFMSHAAVHREFVGHVSDELAVVGIDGFVAHNTMEKGRPWQTQIEQALRTMDAFVAIVHPEFNASAWCQQETGWALGRGVPRFAVRIGANPQGFLGSDQWPSAMMSTPKEVAADIRTWISTSMALGDKIVAGLFRALEGAKNYMDAGAASERVASLGNLTPENWGRLHKIYWDNDQLHGGVLANRALKPFYDANQQVWPPPRNE